MLRPTLPPLTCGARRRHGRGICQSHPLKGHWRCKHHGGRSTGARTPEGQARVTAAMVAGRAKWVERMRRAKAAGLVERFPGGRRPGRKARAKSGTKLVDRALRQVEHQLEEMPAMPATPFAELDVAEKLTVIAVEGSRFLHATLQRPVTPDNPKTARLVTEAARLALALSIKVGPERMRAPKPGRMLDIIERLRAAG